MPHDDLASGDIEGHTINADMLLEDESCEDCRESQCDEDCGCMCHTPVMMWDELTVADIVRLSALEFKVRPYIVPRSHYSDLCEIFGHEPTGIIPAKRIGEM